MTTQLVLIETPADWHLDDTTRAIGRRGLAAARSALQAGGRRAAARELAGRDREAAGDRADAA